MKEWICRTEWTAAWVMPGVHLFLWLYNLKERAGKFIIEPIEDEL